MEHYPYEIKDFDSEKTKEVMSLFTGHVSGYIRVGPKGYMLPNTFKEEVENLYNLPLRPTDVFVVTFPRSGTTLTQELVWLIANDLDYERSNATRLTRRYCYLEFPIMCHPKIVGDIKTEISGNKEKLKTFELLTQPAAVSLAKMPSPRFIKTHMNLSLLPPMLLDTTKVVYVARDPRDVVVSCYHLNRLSRSQGYTGDFKTFWNYFIQDNLLRTPYFEHIKESWDKRHHPNMLFLFYEELTTDMPSCIKRVAKFFNKQIPNEHVSRLCDHLSFDNFKSNKSVNQDIGEIPEFINQGEQAFVREGKPGGWRNYFDEEMTQQAEKWIADNLLNTDLRFPSINCD